MKGFILINAYPNGEKFYRQANRIAEELNALGVQTDIFRNGEIVAQIKTAEICVDFPQKYSFGIYLDKDKYLGKILEQTGMRLFNRAQAVEICDDKMLTSLALTEADIPIAESIPAPLCYTPNAKADETFLQKVAEKLGFPLVVKKSYGSFGEGVRLAKNFEELLQIAREFLFVPHFYQRFVAESFGTDIRVMVIGGKAVAWMQRSAKSGEFRSNIELGGEGKKTELPQGYRQTAEKVAQVLGLDYCGVDLLQGKEGAIVCEVNSNAFFEGLEQTTGINVAKAYAEHILRTVNKI